MNRTNPWRTGQKTKTAAEAVCFKWYKEGRLIPDRVVTFAARVDDWEICPGNNANIALDTLFSLSVNPAQLNNIDELMMIVKYSYLP